MAVVIELDVRVYLAMYKLLGSHRNAQDAITAAGGTILDGCKVEFETEREATLFLLRWT